MDLLPRLSYLPTKRKYLHRPSGAIRIDVDLWSNTHILIPFQALTVPVIVLEERHIQLYAFDIPKFCSVWEEGHS